MQKYIFTGQLANITTTAGHLDLFTFQKPCTVVRWAWRIKVITNNVLSGQTKTAISICRVLDGAGYAGIAIPAAGFGFMVQGKESNCVYAASFISERSEIVTTDADQHIYFFNDEDEGITGTQRKFKKGDKISISAVSNALLGTYASIDLTIWIKF